MLYQEVTTIHNQYWSAGLIMHGIASDVRNRICLVVTPSIDVKFACWIFARGSHSRLATSCRPLQHFILGLSDLFSHLDGIIIHCFCVKRSEKNHKRGSEVLARVVEGPSVGTVRRPRLTGTETSPVESFKARLQKENT